MHSPNLHALNPLQMQTNRRAFLGRASLGTLALGSLLNPSLFGAGAAAATNAPRWNGVVDPLHYTPKVKRVIWLYIAGGMSHLESFDPKPKLAEMDGQPMPDSFTKGQQLAQLQGSELRCFAPQHPFKSWGQSGQQINSIFSKTAHALADDMCIIRSMHTDAINHDPAHTFMNTGHMISGNPAMGSWLLYGLGAETANLPGFVVMISTGKYGQAQPIASRQWHSGFLPSQFQGVQFRAAGDPVLYVNNPDGVNAKRQEDVVSTVAALNQQHQTQMNDPEIQTRIAQYEMAFRMQASVPELMDTSDEPEHILDMYGTRGGDGSFASNCLLARRLAERGTRFIQLYHRDWDHHGAIKDHVKGSADEVDQGTAALVTDLKQRGMLEDTLIVFGTEFGRTPMAQGNGRDHHMRAFSMWMAGAGIKPGITYGATDEL
ncbi:MAG: DUF1501 domain-containing protein, partial [Phycisphaeraceae bacterium]